MVGIGVVRAKTGNAPIEQKISAYPPQADICAFVSTSLPRQNGPHPRNHSRRRRARPRLHRTALSQLVIGEFPMNKILALAAFALAIIASPAAIAADNTITLALSAV